MISCTLNGKKYTVDFVSGRALREMEPAAQMYGRIVAISNAALKGEVPEDAKNLSIGEALDAALALAGPEDAVCAWGSLYSVGELRHCLGLC